MTDTTPGPADDMALSAAEVGAKARTATKWSLLAEVCAKAIIPITQIVLARLLAPEAFGVFAVVVMVSSFAQMLSDAGFQKYLIQREFTSRESLSKSANVAFLASLTVALVLWLVISAWRDPITELTGAPGKGLVLVVAAATLPLSSISSVQQAILRRDFAYRKLMPIRVAVAATPLLVAVPMALAGFDYWALVWGLVASEIVNAVALTVSSPWRPRWYFSRKRLRAMLSFSSWTLVESIVIWMSVWSGSFIVATVLTEHDLGLYRQPLLAVNSIFAVVTGATTPILFASLSRLQGDRPAFRDFFMRFQFAVAMALLPIGVILFVFRSAATEIAFGPEWADASLMVGAWGLSTCFAIVFSHYCSEVFRALGRPRISVLSQVLYMLVMVPAVYLAAGSGYERVVIVSSAVRAVQILLNQYLMWRLTGFGLGSVLSNVAAPLGSAVAVGVLAYFVESGAGDSLLLALALMAATVIAYLALSLVSPRSRAMVLGAAGRLAASRRRPPGPGQAPQETP